MAEVHERLRTFGEPGERVLALLDSDEEVLWAGKPNLYHYIRLRIWALTWSSLLASVFGLLLADILLIVLSAWIFYVPFIYLQIRRELRETVYVMTSKRFIVHRKRYYMLLGVAVIDMSGIRISRNDLVTRVMYFEHNENVISLFLEHGNRQQNEEIRFNKFKNILLFIKMMHRHDHMLAIEQAQRLMSLVR